MRKQEKTEQEKTEREEELMACISEASNRAEGLEIAWRIVMNLAVSSFTNFENRRAEYLRDTVAKQIELKWLDETTRHTNLLKEMYPEMPGYTRNKLSL